MNASISHHSSINRLVKHHLLYEHVNKPLLVYEHVCKPPLLQEHVRKPSSFRERFKNHQRPRIPQTHVAYIRSIRMTLCLEILSPSTYMHTEASQACRPSQASRSRQLSLLVLGNDGLVSRRESRPWEHLGGNQTAISTEATQRIVRGCPQRCVPTVCKNKVVFQSLADGRQPRGDKERHGQRRCVLWGPQKSSNPQLRGLVLIFPPPPTPPNRSPRCGDREPSSATWCHGGP